MQFPSNCPNSQISYEKPGKYKQSTVHILQDYANTLKVRVDTTKRPINNELTSKPNNQWKHCILLCQLLLENQFLQFAQELGPSPPLPEQTFLHHTSSSPVNQRLYKYFHENKKKRNIQLNTFVDIERWLTTYIDIDLYACSAQFFERWQYSEWEVYPLCYTVPKRILSLTPNCILIAMRL